MAPAEATIAVVCAVFGTGSAFLVAVARNATVRALKQAIYIDQLYGQRFQGADAFSADALTLLLGRYDDTDDTWVAADEALENWMQGEVDITPFPELASWWTLDDARCFGLDAPLPKDVVHVLVVRPSVMSNDDASTTMDEEEPRTRTYVHSRVDSHDGREIMACLNIRMEDAPSIPLPHTTDQPVPGFQWTSRMDSAVPRTKAQQRAEYQAYLAANLESTLKDEKLCVAGVDEDLHVLTVGVGDMAFRRQPDLLVLSDSAEKDPTMVQWLPDVRMLVQVERSVDGDACPDAQGLTELLALDLLTTTPVVALLTDLNTSWRFVWIAETSRNDAVVYKATVDSPRDAFVIIAALLSSTTRPDDATPLLVPGIQQAMTRHKLTHVHASIGDGCDVLDVIERYRDIASILGPDIDMVGELARQLVQTIPAFHFHSR